MRRWKRTPLQLEADALNSVIVNEGFAEDPNPSYTYNTKASIAAWMKAKKAGYLRPITVQERLAYVRNRQAIREVILVMVDRVARTEIKRTYYDDPVEDALDALKKVVYQIQDKANSNGMVYYTLTEAGVKRLEELSTPSV